MVYYGLSWFIRVCNGLSWFLKVFKGLYGLKGLITVYNGL